MVSNYIPDKQHVALLQGSSLVTARIFYRMPDFRSILQEFVWQELDFVPHYPVLSKFLDFWDRELEGPIQTVEVSHRSVVSAAEIRKLGTQYFIN